MNTGFSFTVNVPFFLASGASGFVATISHLPVRIIPGKTRVPLTWLVVWEAIIVVRSRVPSELRKLLFGKFTVIPDQKLVPDNVMLEHTPRYLLAGFTELIVGLLGSVTVNTPVLETGETSGFVTTTSHFPSGAPGGKSTVPVMVV